MPFVITTQVDSFSRPFTPVSAPVEAFTDSVLPSRVNSIASPLAVPSKDFVPALPAISIENLSPFLAIVSDEFSFPVHLPTSASIFALGAVAAGLPDGDTAGDDTGLAEAAGLFPGVAGLLGSGVPEHAEIAIAAMASRDPVTSLLILLFFMMMARATLTVGWPDCW